MTITADARAGHHRWLTDLTSLPTAAGREDAVVAWITRWVTQRPALALSTDAAGNLVVTPRGERGGTAPAGGTEPRPVLFTAHLDHPAFVVERVVGPGTLQLAFRGGVLEAYFRGARIAVHTRGGGIIRGVITDKPPTGCAVFPSWLADLDADAGSVAPGDVATWDLPRAAILDGRLHAPACDDLAGVAAALAAIDVLAQEPGAGSIPRLLLTRAEEVGFLGAIAACRLGTIPAGTRVIALENSRSFDDSPIGGGPIVRVGDRLSVFSPGLTASIAALAERIAADEGAAWRWQRKLMPGGACEASVFCAYGHEATCLCLPLGNYHNMGDLAAVQGGASAATPAIAPEIIAIDDFDGLVDLLVACGRTLPADPPVRAKIDRLWDERSFVLDPPVSRR